MMKGFAYFSGVCSAAAFYLTNRAAEIYQAAEGHLVARANEATKLVWPAISQDPFRISTSKASLFAGLIAFALIWVIYVYNVFAAKKYQFGTEHGSAEWGTAKDIKPFMDKHHPDRNMLFTQTEGMTTDTRQTLRNNNVLIVGGSGSGKTRSYVKPNLMQKHSSYVITDPKGEILRSCGKMFTDDGYKVKVFNLINFDQGDQYNPFSYITSEKDILKLINNLIRNTNPPESRTTDPFWEKSEVALLQALFGYIWYEAPRFEKNIGTVMEMLRMAEVNEQDDTYQSDLDLLFADLKEKNPNHFAVKQYDIYKLAAGRTAKGILVSLGVRLSPFFIESLANLLADDTLDLQNIGSEKTALFIVVPDSDKSFNFIAAVLYQQLFDILFHKADNEYGGRLPFHVRFMLDEFPNIGQIPSLETYVATMRSREMSVNIILQNLTQLKSMYKETWETITGNCDTLLFLGGKEQSTLEYISKMIGKTTIDSRNINESRGVTGSYSMNYQVLGRDLITPDEIGKLGTDECILSIRGKKPFRSRKTELTKHKRYKELSDHAPQRAFKPEAISNPFFDKEEFLKDIRAVFDYGTFDLATGILE